MCPLFCCHCNTKNHPLPRYPPLSAKAATMEVAVFLCSYRRVFAPLLKSRFFVIYFRGITLADRKSLPCVKGGGLPKARRRDCNVALRNNPSGKNRRFLPAPLTQGSLCALQPPTIHAIIPSKKGYKRLPRQFANWLAMTLKSEGFL